MAGYFRNDTWREDIKLHESFKKYVREGLQRKEMLNFLRRDYPAYAWSIPTLERQLRHFNIFYTDKTITLETVTNAVAKELDGPGQLLGYRAMHQKLRQEHDINVPRKECFTTRGPNWVHSVDGHNKLMGFQSDTFPLAIYGCVDTASRKLLWLRIWTTNKEPKLIGRWYLEYLFENKIMSSYLRLDRGTETGVMSTIHAFLHKNHDMDVEPTETVIYGPSTANQV